MVNTRTLLDRLDQLDVYTISTRSWLEQIGIFEQWSNNNLVDDSNSLVGDSSVFVFSQLSMFPDGIGAVALVGEVKGGGTGGGGARAPQNFQHPKSALFSKWKMPFF